MSLVSLMAQPPVRWDEQRPLFGRWFSTNTQDCLSGLRGSRCVTPVSVNQHQRRCPLEERVDLPRSLAGGPNTRLQEQFGQQLFEHFLVTTRNDACRVARH